MRNLIRALRGKPVDLSPKQEEQSARSMVGFPQVFNRNEKPSLGPYCGSFDG